MKKIAVLFLMLFLAVTVADASTWVVKNSKIEFNDCPNRLTVVRYGLNYITSGNHLGDACVYVTVRTKGPVTRGCVYFKVLAKNGDVIFTRKERINLLSGREHNYFSYVPRSRIGGRDIKAEIGVACNCTRAGY